MKKLVCVLLALLCAAMLSFAAAEEGCWVLASRSESGEIRLFSGFAVGPRTLLTAPVPEGETLLGCWFGGETGMKPPVSVQEKGGLTLVEMEDELPFVFAVGTLEEENVAIATVENETKVSWSAGYIDGKLPFGGLEAYGLVCDSRPGHGAGVFNADAELVGIAVSSWLEGDAAAVILPAAGALDNRSGWLKNVTVTVEGSLILIKADPPSTTEAMNYALTVADQANTYSTTYPIWNIGEAFRLIAVPGHTYQIGVQRYADQSLHYSTGDSFRTVTLPVGEPYTDYSYQETKCYLGTVAEKDLNNANVMAKPVDAVTADMLGDAERCPVVQVVSTYKVTSQVTMNMTTVLTAPDGNTYWYPGSFFLMRSIMSRDPWSMEIGGLLQDAADLNGSLPLGTYTLSWYFDDRPAGSLAFEVTE